MILNYNGHRTFLSTITFDSIGNRIFRGISEETGLEYYFITHTLMGKTDIITFGPIIVDSEEDDDLVEDFVFNYQQVDCKEKVLLKKLNQYINAPQKKITLVEELPDNMGIPDIGHMISYMINSNTKKQPE